LNFDKAVSIAVEFARLEVVNTRFQSTDTSSESKLDRESFLEFLNSSCSPSCTIALSSVLKLKPYIAPISCTFRSVDIEEFLINN